MIYENIYSQIGTYFVYIYQVGPVTVALLKWPNCPYNISFEFIVTIDEYVTPPLDVSVYH